jgi:hypothetical protein
LRATGKDVDVEPTQIDWGSASVDDGRLTVPLDGEPSKEWVKRVEGVLERLQSGGKGWGELKVTKKKVTVDDVADGSESELRHLLESAVLQANADLAADEDDDDGKDDERSEADQQKTDAFRAFAPPETDDSD